jgi:hypothetical protein
MKRMLHLSRAGRYADETDGSCGNLTRFKAENAKTFVLVKIAIHM